MSFARSVGLPYAPYLLRVARSSVVFWLLMRLSYAAIVLFGVQDGRSAMHPEWRGRLLLVALTAILVHLDRKLAHEHLLQANLGVAAQWFWATSLVVAGTADVITQALLRAV